MITCSECSAEMASGSVACERCGAPRPAPGSVGSVTGEGTAAASAPAVSGFSRGDLSVVALALIGTGMMTFAFLLTRGGSAARPVEAAPAPEARDAAGLPVRTVAVPSWSTRDRARWLGTARRSFAVDVAAASPVAVWMKNVRPVLVVRCMTGAPEVFVFTDSPARLEANTPDHTVRISLDGAEAVTERWPDSADHDALFAPDGAAWLARISQVQTMRFSFTPHNAQEVTAEFNVAGLGDLVAPAARECGFRR